MKTITNIHSPMANENTREMIASLIRAEFDARERVILERLDVLKAEISTLKQGMGVRQSAADPIRDIVRRELAAADAHIMTRVGEMTDRVMGEIRKMDDDMSIFLREHTALSESGDSSGGSDLTADSPPQSDNESNGSANSSAR